MYRETEKMRRIWNDPEASAQLRIMTQTGVYGPIQVGGKTFTLSEAPPQCKLDSRNLVSRVFAFMKYISSSKST
jgi:hypothetical protein